MRILILNWRSINDPLAGGAEKVTLEHAKRWVQNHKAEVTWISPRYENSPNSEVVEGVNFVYTGLPLTRNLLSLLFTYPIFLLSIISLYIKKYRGNVDVVIDQVHGLPFLTPLYVKEKIIVFIHEVAGEIWDKMYPFPINTAGRLFENLVFKLYRKTMFVTGAYGTKDDLLKLNIPEKNIQVINHGLKVDYDFKHSQKENDFTLLYVNRIVKMKGPDTAIEVFEKVKKEIPDAKLWIVGKGEEEYVNELKQIVTNKSLNGSVKFFGFVSEEEKYQLMARAHVFINTSIKEGWGLGNLEANTQGTPAVSFDVPGNRESIRNTTSGYVCKDMNELVKKIVDLKDNPLNKEGIINFPKQFDWEIQSRKMYELF